MSGLSSFGFMFGPQCMVELLKPFFRIIPTVRFGLIFNVNVIAIVHPQTFGSLNAETQRIRTGGIRVMCNDNRLPVCTFDHGGYNIAQVETDFCQRMVFTTIVHDELMQATRLGCHSRQGEETVTTVDIKAVCHRSDSMRRVDIAVTTDRMVRTPLGLCKRIFTHAQLTAFLISIMFSIIEFDIAQIMFVTASRMQQFTKQAFADHVQRSHTITTIANVFHDVQMASRSF